MHNTRCIECGGISEIGYTGLCDKCMEKMRLERIQKENKKKLKLVDLIINSPAAYEPGILKGKFTAIEIYLAEDLDEFLNEGEKIESVEYSYGKCIPIHSTEKPKGWHDICVGDEFRGQRGSFIVTLVHIVGNDYADKLDRPKGIREAINRGDTMNKEMDQIKCWNCGNRLDIEYCMDILCEPQFIGNIEGYEDEEEPWVVQTGFKERCVHCKKELGNGWGEVDHFKTENDAYRFYEDKKSELNVWKT